MSSALMDRDFGVAAQAATLGGEPNPQSKFKDTVMPSQKEMY